METNQNTIRKNKTIRRLDDFQPIPIRQKSSGHNSNGVPGRFPTSPQKFHKGHPKTWIALLIIIAAYFFAPLRTNILILGTDYLPHRDTLSRTDTNIMVTINPWKPYVGMLSIPRDLWVVVPNVGENRINTAYFFAEATQTGSGPDASIETIHNNFGITLKYYLVIKMEGVVKIIDAVGGVEVELPAAMGGLPIGTSFLDGTQALAFARERYSADDFSRMNQGQILLKALINKILSPAGWIRIPLVVFETLRAIDTNVPWWLVPRLGFALLRAGSKGIDNRTINREMVTPFMTSDGAQVLAPNWEAINPVLLNMFGE